jgi:hypothetical protein
VSETILVLFDLLKLGILKRLSFREDVRRNCESGCF